MQKIKVQVTGITKEEFTEALHQEAFRFYRMLIVVMVIFCGVILLASQNPTMYSVIAPLVIYAVVVICYEVYIRVNYKNEMQTIDSLFYEFNEKSWKAIAGEVTNEIEWKKTPRMTKKKRGLYLYNTETTSSLIPLRFLNEEELAQINAWYDESREAAKKFQKMIEEQSRMTRKNNMQQNTNRIIGRGPAWGPFKRK